MHTLHIIFMILLWPAFLVGVVTGAFLLVGYVHDRWFRDTELTAWLIGTSLVLGFVASCFL